MTSTDGQEPQFSIELGKQQVTVLGTAHVSQASADTVKQLLATGDYQAVAIELCPSRYNAIVNPDALAQMDLFEVIRKGKASMVIASLALSAFQQRVAEQFDIQPGAEMRAAIETAKAAKIPVLLIDREVGITLKRVYHNVPWWRRMNLVAGLIGSVASRQKVSEEEIESLKEGDVLEATFAQFADQSRELYQPLVDERDRYMAARIHQELEKTHHGHILAVVGAGHMQGIKQYLQSDPEATQAVIDKLDRVPPANRWLRILPWLVVALIITGFIIGFQRSPELGWQLVIDWVVINGGLASLGAIIAAAHPITVIGAFVAAPLTSLNPMIGAGIVTAGIEIYLRKPSVGDFSLLRTDTAHLKGWWRNRVARILLVFLFSTLGSALGTYLAGFRIFERITG